MGQHQEVWLYGAGGNSICALINGSVGWLMYLRYNGDIGFCSRNPDYTGDLDTEIGYTLANGQQDWYPASWAVSRQQVLDALDYFRANEKPSPNITWYNDSGDGTCI
ncbi:hypothetical protein [Roseibium sp.]|uniref:hypothetical protein n=1 Tax=Roseibium sp. TaxID=1936156 RepID=UPI003D0B4AAB